MISTGKNKVTELKLHRQRKERTTALRSGRGNNKLLLLVALLVVGYIMFSLTSQFSRLHAMQAKVDTLQNQIEEIEKRNTALREQIKQIKSDAYIEQVAREQLGLVKPGETLVVPANAQPGEEAKEQAPQQSPQQPAGEGFRIRYNNIYD